MAPTDEYKGVKILHSSTRPNPKPTGDGELSRFGEPQQKVHSVIYLIPVTARVEAVYKSYRWSATDLSVGI